MAKAIPAGTISHREGATDRRVGDEGLFVRLAFVSLLHLVYAHFHAGLQIAHARQQKRDAPRRYWQTPFPRPWHSRAHASCSKAPSTTSCDGTMIGSPLAGDNILLVDIIKRARFKLRFDGQRDMHSHLVAIKVRVVRCTHEWVQLDRLTLNQHRLKCLDAQVGATLERGSRDTGCSLNDLSEDIPDLGEAPARPFSWRP